MFVFWEASFGECYDVGWSFENGVGIIVQMGGVDDFQNYTPRGGCEGVWACLFRCVRVSCLC